MRRAVWLAVMSPLTIPGGLIAALSVAGSLYVLAAAILTARFMAKRPANSEWFPPVTLLKPLHREPDGLSAALDTFCRQNYPAPVQILFGVQDAADPAVAVARAVQAAHPGADLAVVVDPKLHGQNRKISNLINLDARAGHEVLVLSDADIRVGAGYLRAVTGALAQPGVGAVSCLYVGRPLRGTWSSLAAMAIDYGFLPNAVLGSAIGMATPCCGSTIALTRTTLGRIGGFAAFSNHLADDYEIGRAVRALGQSVAIPPMVVTHGCGEASLGEVIGHEIRWGRTVKLIDPGGYAGSLITHPLPLALIAALLLGQAWLGPATVLLALGARLAAKRIIDAATGGRAGAWWLLPARDLLSFWVFLACFAGSSVTWQGRRYRIGPDGALIAA